MSRCSRDRTRARAPWRLRRTDSRQPRRWRAARGGEEHRSVTSRLTRGASISLTRAVTDARRSPLPEPRYCVPPCRNVTRACDWLGGARHRARRHATRPTLHLRGLAPGSQPSSRGGTCHAGKRPLKPYLRPSVVGPPIPTRPRPARRTAAL
jgi:hypothetical protein